MRIELIRPDEHAAIVPPLARILVACVADGASVGFLHPLPLEDAATWWAAALAPPTTLTWVARDGDAITGAVQLMLARFPNGLHRATVAKLLVDPLARGAGVASALLATLEAHACAIGRTLLQLDTQTGSLAEGVYLRRGWVRIGVVEGHAVTPDGRLAPTTFMYKQLR